MTTYPAPTAPTAPTAPADRPHRGIWAWLATGIATAAAAAVWACLVAGLAPGLRATGFGPVEAWAVTAVLPALAAFAVRQRLLLVPVGVLTVVLHHHAWHQQQGPEFGWGWFPALGESSCVLFLGVALPWMVHLLPALSRAEQN